MMIIILSPLILFVGVLVRVILGSPIIFRQERSGLFGKSFELLKFRTMSDSDGVGDGKMTDDERLSRFGRLLRSTSLDELPGLWNVVLGDMSLVGPRPLLIEYMDLYSVEQFRRHNVRPGVTGLAQVNGRNALSWEEKFALDVWYVDNRSMLLDIKILCKTLIKVLARDGISQEDQATARKFTGSRM